MNSLIVKEEMAVSAAHWEGGRRCYISDLHQQVCHPALQQTKWHLEELHRVVKSGVLSQPSGT